MNSKFKCCVMLVAGFAVCAADLAMAQNSRRGGGWFGGNESALGLLQSEKIRGDLELVDDQLAEFEAIRDEVYRDMREMWQGMRDMSREERRERFEQIRAEMESRREELEERVDSVLLPHQQTRLKQLVMQSQARRQGGTIGFVASDGIAEKLKLTDEQRAKLKKTAEEVRQDLDERIKKLRKNAEEKILSVLTAEQRKQYESMMGESFEFDDRDRWWNRGGRDRRDRERGDRGENERQSNDTPE